MRLFSGECLRWGFLTGSALGRILRNGDLQKWCCLRGGQGHGVPILGVLELDPDPTRS